ncbi:hypothetical protein SLA2020_131150 [Shorea laevis]
MQPNITSIKTSSDGAWQGDNPLNHAFPLLIIQSTLVLFTSRFLAFLLKPLRQPKVVAEIVGGILLGPSALGRNKEFLHLVFPSWSTPILESVASIGLLFFLFLVGLELDLSSIRRSTKKALGIAVAGISLPFFFGAGVSIFLRKAVHGDHQVNYGQYLMFIGVALSITAFPVLARILAELKLLTTQVGQTAMAAAALNDVVAWVLLALAIAIAGNGPGEAHRSPLISIWVLLSGLAFVAFMFILVQPIMNWMARQCSPDHDFVDDTYICLTLAGVMLSGFMTDLIGIHAIFGAFVFGLTIPRGSAFAGRLMKRIEDFVTGLLLPLYFASSGLKTDVAKIRGAEAWGLLVLVITTACTGKIVGTFVVAMMSMIPVRESLALGVLMNTKGLVELIVLNIGREKKVLNDEMFAILVLMALFTTFMTTPAVLAIYKPLRRVYSPARRRLEQPFPPAENSKEELRILTCVHGPSNVPSLINVIESIRTSKKSPFKLYVLHLVELSNRSSSIVMVQETRKNGMPFVNRFRRGASLDEVATAFEAYGQVRGVTIRHSTAVSALPVMHQDICHLAEEKRVAMIILPFHKQWTGDGEEAIETIGDAWRDVNQMVLRCAPCSVAVFVDRGFGSGSEEVLEPTTTQKRIGVLFTGGANDREALALGGRVAEPQPNRVTLVRLLVRDENEIETVGRQEQDLNEAAVSQFRQRWDANIQYEEKAVSNVEEGVLAVGQSQEYELLVVGNGMSRSTMVSGHNHNEHAELGPIGNILASSDSRIRASVLVIQQYTANDNEATGSKMMQSKEAVNDGQSAV